MNLSTLALALVAGFSLPAAVSQEEGRPVLSLSEIVLDQYSVQHVDAGELYTLATELAGRQYFLKERGGTEAEPVDSLRMLGESIVLYDTRAEVERTKQLLARLDVPRAEEASSWKMSEYRPRFLSLDTAARAAATVVSADQLEERGLVMLSGDGRSVDGALALLARIDVPERQVLLTCLMIEVDSDLKGPDLPPDLAGNLQKLLPQSRFTQTGMAMLKTSVTGSAQISLEIETLEGQSYRLSFAPVSFDETSASLTIANCALVQNDERELFRTNTVLRGGEYTVLAATGSAPKLLVVRVVPQG
jgi:hypothetical protein